MYRPFRGLTRSRTGCKIRVIFEKEHKIVQDKELARKESELNALKAKDKEPLHIPELDERKLILSQGPRVKPIVPTAETQRTLNNAK